MVDEQVNTEQKQTWEQTLNEKSQVVNKEKSDATAKKKGVELLIDKTLQTSARLPMLEITYDRFIRVIATSFRNFTSGNVEPEIEYMKNERFGDFIDKIPSPSMLSVFKVTEWDNFGLMITDASMIYAFVEVLFGGRKTESSLKVEGRAFTSIESSVVKSITEIILHDLSLAFNPITSATFQLDRIETNPKFAMIVRPEDVAILLNIKVNMDNRSGNIYLVLPYSTIEPVKKILARPYIGERGSKDPNWAKHFENEVANATVKIEVVLGSVVTNLKDIASFEVGKTLMLDKAVDTDWEVRLNQTIISTGQPGKTQDKLAIQLNDRINIERYKK